MTKYIVTFNMKSGDKIKFKCMNIKITTDTNELTSYIVEPNVPELFYVRMSEIESMKVKETFF